MSQKKTQTVKKSWFFLMISNGEKQWHYLAEKQYQHYEDK